MDYLYNKPNIILVVLKRDFSEQTVENNQPVSLLSKENIAPKSETNFEFTLIGKRR